MTDEVIIDTTATDGARVYAEVGSDGNTVRLYTEDKDVHGVMLKMTPLETLDLIAALTRAVTGAIA